MPLNSEKRQAVVDILISSGILKNTKSKTKDKLNIEKLNTNKLGIKIKDSLLDPLKKATKSFYDKTTQAIKDLK